MASNSAAYLMSAHLPTPALLERLGEDHARIAAVIRELGELIDPLSSELDWQRLSELMEFLDYFADRVHHPLEDRLFDRLTEKGLTPTERHLVFRNMGQHQRISANTESLSSLVRTAQQGAAVDEDAFREAAMSYIGLQRRHMRFEEAHLFPLLESAFDNDDWNSLSGTLVMSD